MTRRCLVCLTGVLTCGAVAPEAGAQPLGTFRWQLLPFCNVISVAITQNGAVYRLEGTDDQCGNGADAASVTGTAFPNADGTIGFGLNVTLTAARLYAGYASLDLGNVDRAREYFEQALDAHPTLYSVVTPERAELWVGLARLHLRNGDAAGARKFAEEADAFWSQRDARNPWAGEAAYWLGRTFEAAGDRATGREAFRRASKALRTSSLPVHVALGADASTRAGAADR